MFSPGSRSKKHPPQAGFTLFELLISMLIIGIITAIVVIGYASYYSSTLLKNQVYEMALDIREAQVFAISSRVEGSATREEYGIYFATSKPNTYQLFHDNGATSPPVYNTGEEVGDAFIIDSRFKISRICINSCSTNVNNVSVSFKRPNFDAQARVAGSGVTVNDVRIEVQSRTDSTAVMAVEISPTGQVSVKADTP